MKFIVSIDIVVIRKAYDTKLIFCLSTHFELKFKVLVYYYNDRNKKTKIY